MRIVVTGSIAVDYIMSFPGRFRDSILADMEKISLSFLVDEMHRVRGGTAANIAYSLALLGERPTIMATAGEDFADYRRFLEASGVDTSALKSIEGVYTASFFVSTDIEQNQIATFYAGAMAYAGDLSFRDLPFRPDWAIISPNDPRAMANYPRECRELGIHYLYDPSQQIARMDAETLRDGLQGADILIVNDYEYEMLKQKTGLDDAALRAAVKMALVVTRGPDGSTIWAEGRRWDLPIAKPKAEVDPTGVGDAYRAGLLKGMAMGMPWPVCGRIGALAAAYVIERPGPQSHHYTLDEFVRRYRETFGEDAFTEAMQA